MTERSIFLLISLLTILLIAVIVPVYSSGNNTGRAFVEGEVLVTLSTKVGDSNAWVVRQGFSPVGKPGRDIRSLNAQAPVLIRLAQGQSTASAISTLRTNSDVVSVQPNYIYHLYETISDDPRFSLQWALKNTGQLGGTLGADINATLAWDITTGSDQVLVAVIDTGIDYNHVDLAGNLWTNPGEQAFPDDGFDNDGNGYVDDWRGWDFYDNDNDPDDDHTHGTHVGGIIAAVGNNGIGVSGVCWNLKLMPLDGFSAAGDSTSSGLIEAIDYANQMGAKIINASWGDQYYDQAMLLAIRRFTAAGGLFVCAAGNENGEDNDMYSSYPANFDVDALIAVGASNRYGQVAGLSSIGRNRVHLFAPGQDIYSTMPGSYGNKSGTSMASPAVAGAAALLWAWQPSLSNLQVKYRILGGVNKGASFVGRSFSGGHLNTASMFGEDSVSPAAVSNLRVIGNEYDRLNLAFTATGDDGAGGSARFYDIRYSTTPITESNWEAAARSYGEPVPLQLELKVFSPLSGLDEAAVYHIRMKSIDESGNLSPLSNEATGMTEEVRDILVDNMESGVNGWSAYSESTVNLGQESGWGLTDVFSHSGDYCWSDSPDGDYVQGDFYLVSPPVDLTSARQPILRFWHKYDIETSTFQVYDFAEVQVSADGLEWSEALARYYDTADWWLQETLDLSQWKGQGSIRLRFHLYADAPVDEDDMYDGWYIDDVRVLDVQKSTPGLWILYGSGEVAILE